MFKQQISTILEKEVDRRGFLKHIGVAIVAVIGLSSLIQNLSTLDTSKKRSSGYGRSFYGK